MRGEVKGKTVALLESVTEDYCFWKEKGGSERRRWEVRGGVKGKAVALLQCHGGLLLLFQKMTSFFQYHEYQ